MAEEAMFGFGRRRFRPGADVVSACVVGDQYGTALGIRVVGVGQRDAPDPEVGKEHERGTRTSHPRLAAEHQFSLPIRLYVRQACSLSARGRTFATSLSDP